MAAVELEVSLVLRTSSVAVCFSEVACFVRTKIMPKIVRQTIAKAPRTPPIIPAFEFPLADVSLFVACTVTGCCVVRKKSSCLAVGLDVVFGLLVKTFCGVCELGPDPIASSLDGLEDGPNVGSFLGGVDGVGLKVGGFVGPTVEETGAGKGLKVGWGMGSTAGVDVGRAVGLRGGGVD